MQWAKENLNKIRNKISIYYSRETMASLKKKLEIETPKKLKI